jgi:16S rRNA (cytosine1402-N4)-methyltransferase
LQVKYDLHTPVMLNEVLNCLNLAPGKTIIDATIGVAGHSEGILERIWPGGRLIGIDQDQESLKIAGEKLARFAGHYECVHGNFKDIATIIKETNIEKIDAVLFDLGISSFQLDDPCRGFSFQQEGPLDMRLDRTNHISAYDLVNNLNEEEISTLLWNFGQERWHNRIAHRLIQEREKQPITTTSQLVDIVWHALPSRYRYQRIHPATRTFQAMRIAVNRELEVLEVAIVKAIDLLEKAGRICVISFHSLEDRIVKHSFKKAALDGKLEIITSKPLTPTRAEIQENPASRSAKLRAGEKL